ncbi:uncharacterized protein CTRU02_212522 [Colletotrichum truncatum]|uniref:Uncharacterized protein n=1 Tax=Colletotrichum truncatum TaxID=5467 RepID=A0ACC3YNT4_COLTU|nr:uncharacterized protein CTRU02_05665 [Colletotrichum truncatum]KAF6794108.1 hypothetical protein CTRU02_05665 [Colletotrichum truncatum]
MDEYEVFHRLATYPFSSSTMEMFQCALRLIRSRYPIAFCRDAEDTAVEFPPMEDFFKQEKMPLHVTGEWISYMQTVACSVITAEQGVSPSLWRLARDDHVDIDVVTDYLQLLRLSYPSFHFTDPVPIASDTIENVTGLLGTPDAITLIPCHYNGAWFTAIAYTDCVQLYGMHVEDSPKIKQLLQVLFPRRLIRFSQPPLAARLEDSGVWMLLSMRMLVAGGLPMQHVDTTFLRSSRARIFIELLMKKLDVKESDVSTRIQEAQAENSLFFDEAFISEDYVPTPSGSISTPDREEDCNFTLGGSPEQFSRSSLSPEEQPSSRERSSGAETAVSAQAPRSPSSSPQPPSPQPTEPTRKKLASLRSSQTSGMPQRMSKQCKDILDMLSEAVIFYRSSRMSEKSELPVIWSAMNSGFKSEFYRRYICVLFYKQMDRLASDEKFALQVKTRMSYSERRKMNSFKSRCKIWHDICELRHNWGPAKYALLCVMPEKPNLEHMKTRERGGQLKQLGERLNDKYDDLSSYVEAATGLCTALVQGSLPCGLMIDDYHLRPDQEFMEPEFAAYTSLNPRPVISIPRWTSD